MDPHQVDDDTHPSAFLRGRESLGIQGFKGGVIFMTGVLMSMIFHIGCASMSLHRAA